MHYDQLTCARCGFTTTASTIAEGLPRRTDGTLDVRTVEDALRLVVSEHEHLGDTIVCAQCIQEGDELGEPIFDPYGTGVRCPVLDT